MISEVFYVILVLKKRSTCSFKSGSIFFGSIIYGTDVGYPSVGALREWYRNYLKSGKISHNQKIRKNKYTEEQTRHAVKHYFEYGQCYARTIRMLGYPCRDLLKRWCEEQAPKARKLRKSAVNLTHDQKQEIVKKFYQPQTNRKKLAEAEGVSRESLYQWKNSYLGKDFPLHMSSKNPR